MSEAGEQAKLVGCYPQRGVHQFRKGARRAVEMSGVEEACYCGFYVMRSEIVQRIKTYRAKEARQ